MICKRILPCVELRCLIREYLVAQFTFKDTTKQPPLRAYPANPEEAIRFLITGKLYSNNPATGITCETPGHKRSSVNQQLVKICKSHMNI